MFLCRYVRVCVCVYVYTWFIVFPPNFHSGMEILVCIHLDSFIQLFPQNNFLEIESKKCVHFLCRYIAHNFDTKKVYYFSFPSRVCVTEQDFFFHTSTPNYSSQSDSLKYAVFKIIIIWLKNFVLAIFVLSDKLLSVFLAPQSIEK